MSEPILNTLTQRLDRLERENRRLKIAGAILLLALAAVGAMGQVLPKAVPKVVEAERFVVRDTKGKVLATLGTEASGLPALVLSDQNGKRRAGLFVLADGEPHLGLFDQNEKRRAVLAVLADGAPALFLADQNGKDRAGLVLDTSGPSLVLRDENDKIRAVLGRAALEATATGTVEQRPAASLVLFDKDGKVIWKVP